MSKISNGKAEAIQSAFDVVLKIKPSTSGKKMPVIYGHKCPLRLDKATATPIESEDMVEICRYHLTVTNGSQSIRFYFVDTETLAELGELYSIQTAIEKTLKDEPDDFAIDVEKHDFADIGDYPPAWMILKALPIASERKMPDKPFVLSYTSQKALYEVAKKLKARNPDYIGISARFLTDVQFNGGKTEFQEGSREWTGAIFYTIAEGWLDCSMIIVPLRTFWNENEEAENEDAN